MNEPQSHLPESSLLAVILLAPEKLSEIRTIVPPDNFLHPKHRLTYEKMLELADSAQAVDITTLSAAIGGGGATAQWLSSLLDSVLTTSNWRSYAKIISEAAARAKAERLVAEWTKALADKDNAMAAILESFQAGLMELQRAAGGDERATYTYSEVLGMAIDDIEHRMAGRVSGVPTGFMELDELTDGMLPGQFWVVSAYTSRGKSIFAEQVAQSAARHGCPVLFETLEMSAKATGHRALARQSGIPAQILRRAKFGDEERRKVLVAFGEMGDLPIFVRDRDNVSLPKILNNARMHRLNNGIGLLVVDYIGLIQVPGVKADNLRVRLSEASAGLKNIAKELGITVLAVSQQARPHTDKGSKLEPEPTLFGLKESGSIENDCDTAVLLHRPDFLDPEKRRPDGSEDAVGILAKQREGPAQVRFPLVFDRNRVRWLNPSAYGLDKENV